MKTSVLESHRLLIVNAFAKAETELREANITKISKYKMAERVSHYLTSNGFSYGYRSLTNLYNDAMTEGQIVVIKQTQVIELLSMYLGYEEFAEFRLYTKKNTSDPSKTNHEPVDPN
ncbi:hypothetical protein BST97_08065 [Nonlabens spongiae]|uniref:Uncharacterized protein n=1 Tax=Nonlabens spongiae TaxID=331648 RepID=A0A1W6MKB5_9FLAO|nr:hypothetical protein [Nonlabens spongiae]ARN77956.1 hypothetical protein BST97_08065 [Nonlabens spongiae]